MISIATRDCQVWIEDSVRSLEIDDQLQSGCRLASDEDLPPRPGTPLGFSEELSDMFRYNCSSSSPPSPRPAEQGESYMVSLCNGPKDTGDVHEDISHMIMEATDALLHVPSPCPDPLSSSAYNQVDGLSDGSEDIIADFDVLLKTDIEDMSDSVTLVAPRPIHPPVVPSSCSPPITTEVICPSSRPKFVSPPSLLSPHGPYRRASCLPPPPRHNYVHRGHSRHALLQIKWFWQAREEEWAEYTAKLRHADFHAKLSAPISPPSRGSSPSSCHISPPSHTRQHMPPMSVHPRWGDATVLRDPHCAHMDRYFVGMPMYTMRKALWMFDVHLGLERASYPVSEASFSTFSPEYSDSDDDISCEDMMFSSSFTSLSDDSESTLVESENEEMSLSSFDEADITIEQVEVAEDEEFFAMEEIDLDSTPRFESTQKFAHGPPPPSTRSVKTSPSWEINWYRRLELLLSITQMEHNRQNSTTPIA